MLTSLTRLIDDVEQLRGYAAFLREATSLGRSAKRPEPGQTYSARAVRWLAARYLPTPVDVAPLRTSVNGVSSAMLSRLNYSALIVALYGAVERFGEASISEYVEYLNRVSPSYGALPAQLRDAHLEAAVKLLQAPDRDRYAAAEEVVNDLHSCLSGGATFRINPGTFAYHSANFRSALFRDLWARVGVSALTDSILADDGYRAAVDALDPSTAPSFFRFDDVAERRNEVAHGSTPSDILSIDIFLGYAAIVAAFCQALVRRATSAGLAALTQHHGHERGDPIAVYNNEIVCLSCSVVPIAVGDLLVARLPSGDYSAGLISSLQVESASQQQVDPAGSVVDVGMKIDFHAKQNQVFWTVPQAGPIGDLWRGRFA